jgi:hypothetical protein
MEEIMDKKKIFISHVSDEADIAILLKAALTRDFLDFVEVFVSSDTESIAAGEEWLVSIKRWLEKSDLLIVLCSPTSIDRPWINFEAGAAWMRGIPLVPLCHAGLMLSDLRMPLSLRQGAEIERPDGLKRLYGLIATVLGGRVPDKPFDELVHEIARSASTIAPALPSELTRDRAIKKRLTESLQDPDFPWRTIERVAREAVISEDLAADLLRTNPEVRFGKGKTGNIIVGLRSRIGDTPSRRRRT